MGIFRSYFSKNNTVIGGSLINTAKNPVTDISYGGENNQPSRFIFDIDLEPLLYKIQKGLVNPSCIKKHTLKMQNTIRFSPEYVGKKGYSSDFQRASEFTLNLFNVNQDWDEGVGYDMNFERQFSSHQNDRPSNWTQRLSDETLWDKEGVIGLSGDTDYTPVGTQYFNQGSEDIEIDVTDYVNQRLEELGVAALSGDTNPEYDNSNGLGLKFTDDVEQQGSGDGLSRFMVSFHTKYTNTFYEPFIETDIDCLIEDDRNYFFLDKKNKLYFYPTTAGISNVGGAENIVINSVTIKDDYSNVVAILSGDDIKHNGGNVYYVELSVDSNSYPDAINFEDVWDITADGNNIVIEDQFYLVDLKKYYNFNNSKDIEFGNYSFYYWGLQHNEKVVSGDIRRVKLTVRELYATSNDFTALNIEYRIFTKVGENHELDVIPYTKVNRTRNTYNIILDTSWLIPQDYYLQVRLVNSFYSETKETLKFSIVSNKLK